MREYKEEKKDC